MPHPNTLSVRTLTLVNERKIDDLLPKDGPDRLEASGVVALPDGYYVVFDNHLKVAQLVPDLLQKGRRGNLRHVQGKDLAAEGFEDLAYDPHRDRFYLLIECTRTGDNEFKAQLVECDASFEDAVVRTLPFPFASKKRDFNKGFEGVAIVRRAGIDYLLALREAPTQKASLTHDQIVIFARAGDDWHLAGTLALPDPVQFKDYAAIDVRDNRVAVVSQEDAMLWVGTLREVGFEFVDSGRTYRFPPDFTGEGAEREVYCNVEGVAWVTPTRIVAVSDARKLEQPCRCKEKSQSIHIFDL